MRTDGKNRAAHLIIALAVALTIVVPVASATAGSTPKHHRHHGKNLHKGKRGKKAPATVKDAAKRLAALRAEAAGLTKRIATVKAGDDIAAAAPKVVTAPAVQQSVAAASGPAGGALTGAYPAPTLAPRSVDHAAILPNSIGTANVVPKSLTADDFAPSSITSPDIADGSLPSTKIANRQIYADRLSESFRWPPETHGPNLSATLQPGGHSVRVASTCPNETRMVSGGFIWKNLEGSGTEILNSSPGSLVPSETINTWEVVAKVQTGGDVNTITPVALCLE